MPAPGTVLVVDDEPSIRLLCRVNLELDGYRVVDAASVASARELLAAEHVDVVLLDRFVGPDDGVELLRELCTERPELPVAMLTGSSEADELRSQGAAAIVTKPFTLDSLRETVGGLVAAVG